MAEMTGQIVRIAAVGPRDRIYHFLGAGVEIHPVAGPEDGLAVTRRLVNEGVGIILMTGIASAGGEERHRGMSAGIVDAMQVRAGDQVYLSPPVHPAGAALGGPGIGGGAVVQSGPRTVRKRAAVRAHVGRGGPVGVADPESVGGGPASRPGLTRWVVAPRPGRPSKWRLVGEAQRWPGDSTAAVMARHIEQPGWRHSKPAATRRAAMPSARQRSTKRTARSRPAPRWLCSVWG